MAATEIICPMCGFKNPADAARCSSCGARIEAVRAEYTEEEEAARRHQQENFEPKWVGISAGVYLALQMVILVGLPFVVKAFDPQGIGGLFISMAVWAVGGVLVGLMSPGKTFLEPAVGALIAVVPTIAYLMIVTPDGFDPSLLAYIVGGLIGVMLSLFGAFLGERLQGQKKPTARAA